MLPRRRVVQAGGALAASLAVPRLLAAPGGPVVLGHVAPATGAFASAALAMRQGLEAAVAEANSQGGVRGGDVKLVSLDDGYSAPRSLALAQQLKAQGNLAALLAPFGKAAMDTLMPWAAETRTPLIGARSGAETQRSYHRWTFFNIASVADEVAFLARHLATVGARRLGVFFMADPAGTEAWQRLSAAAQQHGLTALRAESFSVNPVPPATGGKAAKAAAAAAQASVPAVLKLSPEAVVLGGGGAGAEQVLRDLLAAGFPASRIYTLSLLHAEPLATALGSAAEGLVCAQVVPSPEDQKLPLAVAYRRALQRLPAAQPSAFGLEAYLSAQIALRALRQVPDAQNSEAVVDALEQAGRFLVGGLQMHYDKTQHRGSRVVELARVSGGRLRR
ncbi:MAG: ABC transporter substrate-binding protein [Rubrivivax sp.]